MDATGKRRLLKLADFLETAELPGDFRMRSWSGGPDAVKGGKPLCGTAACACGWATTIPSFYKAGLRLTEYGGLRFGGHDGRFAAAAFFGIPPCHAGVLFMPDDMDALTGKRGRRTVARRIRKLVASEAA